MSQYHQHPWNYPYATQYPDPTTTSFTTSTYLQQLPVRPPSPRQVNPYSPEYHASPSWSDASHSIPYSTPELEATGLSSVEDEHPTTLFSSPSPQADSSEVIIVAGLNALASPEDPMAVPQHTMNTMIIAALQDSPHGKLPSRDICRAIQDRFPYYRSSVEATRRMKGTVRHHLSNAGLFSRAGKDSTMRGKGDYWMYDPTNKPAKVAKKKAATKKATRQSPASSASSPYPRTRRGLRSQPEDAAFESSTDAASPASSSQHLGPIRVSTRGQQSTRLALPQDRVSSSPQPVHRSAGPSTTRQLQPHPSHGMWSPRVPISSVHSSPEQPTTLLMPYNGLGPQPVAGLDGFLGQSYLGAPSLFAQSPPRSNAHSPVQHPLPQISSSPAENTLHGVAVSSDAYPFDGTVNPASLTTANPLEDWDMFMTFDPHM